MKKYISAAVSRWNKEERLELARKSSNLKVLYRLMFDRDEEVRYVLCQNKNVPKSFLKDLFDTCGSDQGTGDAILAHPNCDEDLIRYILNDKKYLLRYPSTAGYILDKTQDRDIINRLMNMGSDAIREVLASDDNIPQDILEQFAFDGNPRIRKAVACRESVTPDLLEILAYDPDPDIRSIVFSNPATPIECVNDYLDSCDYSKASQDRYKTLVAIAERDDITADRLENIFDNVTAGDFRYDPWDHANLFNAIARNPNLSQSLMAKLCPLGNGSHASIILSHKDVPDAIVQLIANLFKNKQYNNGGDNFHYRLIDSLLDKSKDSEFLQYMYDTYCGESKSWENTQHKEHLAANMYTPVDILTRLVNDRSERVRNNATRTLATVGSEQLDQQAQAAKRAQLSQPISPTTWRISPYTSDTYSDLAEELDILITKVMNSVAKSLKCKLTYQFDTDDYDEATTITITTDTGKECTLGAQSFLARITSDPSKNVCVKRTTEYLDKQLRPLVSGT